MIRKLFADYVYPVAVLAGGIIGAGFLSLPYLALRVGIWPMLLYFVCLTALVVTLHVIYGKICRATPDFKQFPGFVEFYLGRWAKRVTLALVFLGSLGISLSYLIIGGRFLSEMLAPVWPGGAYWYTILYFFVLSAILYFDMEAIPAVEFGALFLLLAALLLIFVKGFSLIRLENIFFDGLVATRDWRALFLPYGVIIFSLWGTGLIAQVEEMLIGRKRLLTRVVVIGTLVPAVFYFLFMLAILGISGHATSEAALSGLASFLGRKVVEVALLIGVLTSFMAFIGQGLFFKKVLMYDLKMDITWAWFLTCFPALLFFLLGINSFIPLVSFVGGVFLGVEGIFILLMYRKIGGRKAVVYPLFLIFFIGIIYEIMYFIH